MSWRGRPFETRLLVVGKLRLVFALLVVVFLPALVGCGGSNARPVDASAAARADANRRLQGDWVLQSYQPEVALEPMLQGLLAVQIGHLRVSCDGQQLTAVGPGVSATRRYVVTDAAFNRLKVTVYDEGVPYLVQGEFQGNQLAFHALTSPWRGSGMLVRAR